MELEMVCLNFLDNSLEKVTLLSYFPCVCLHAYNMSGEIIACSN